MCTCMCRVHVRAHTHTHTHTGKYTHTHTHTIYNHTHVHMLMVKLRVTADSNTADHTLINRLNQILREHKKALGYQNYSQSHIQNTWNFKDAHLFLCQHKCTL